MQFNNKLLCFAVTLLLSAIGVTPARATHFAAGDLYVTYIGAGIDNCKGTPEYKYDVTLILYGACEWIPTKSATIGVNQFFNYGSANAGFTQLNVPMIALDSFGNVAPTNYDGQVVHQLCPDEAGKNSCVDPTTQDKYPGFKKWVFHKIITLPSPQTDWRFWYSGSARNAGIANLFNPQGSFYIEAGLNNLKKFNVSTPRFTSNPLPYICNNVPYQYLNGPFDPDADTRGQRMVVAPQVPLRDATTPYTYNPGFNAANPINSTTGYSVNPVSGTAKFSAQNQGKYVLAFRIEKWAINNPDTLWDDELIAYTTRDVQVSVLDCGQPAPITDTMPQNLTNATWKPLSETDSAIYVCPGSEMSFDINAKSTLATNNLYWSSNYQSVIPTATFTKGGEGTSQITGHFSWTPTQGDVGDHSITFIAKDSTCSNNQPIVLPTPLVFVIRVTPGLDAGPDLYTCQYNPKGYQVLVRGTDYKLRVHWSDINGGPAVGIDSPNSKSPVIKAQGKQTYLVYTPDLSGGCKNQDTLALKVDESDKIDIKPDANSTNITDKTYVLCRPDYLQLDAIFSGRPPLYNISCGINKPVECKSPLSVDFFGSFAYEYEVTYDTLGSSTPFFSNLVRTSKKQFLIRKDEMKRYGLDPSSIKSVAFEVVDAQRPDHEYSNFTISMKCTDKTELNIKDGFEKGMQRVYTAPGPIKIPKGWNEFAFDTAYNYDSTKNIIIEFCYHDNATVDICNSPILRFVPTHYISGLNLAPYDLLTLAPNPSVLSVYDTFVSKQMISHYTRPLLRFKYCETPPAPLTYKWFPGTLLSDSTIQQPLAYVPKTQQYIIETFGRSGCKLFDTLNIYVPVHDYSVTPADTAICFGEPAPLHAKHGFTYKWYEYKDGVYTLATRNATCWDCADPILTPKATTTYKIVVYDSVWCTDTLTARVEVMPLPDVHILNNDTIVKYGQAIQLLVNGARTYNWFQAGSVNNTNLSNPIARPTERTDYVVGGIGKNGCRAFDTVTVDVDYRDNLFIPSAFSPNGDGKNDVFHIANLTFQRVLEFRVFNRWGQEVFYSNDNQHGWDGKWKGVPQDMGSYQYLIRLGYPDGLVETYKGAVTLIR